MNNDNGAVIDDDVIHNPAQLVHEVPESDTDLEDPAPLEHALGETDGSSVAATEIDESAQAEQAAQTALVAHGPPDDGGHDTAIAPTPKRRRNSSSSSSSNINSSRLFNIGSLLGTPTRSQVKRTKKLRDYISPPVSCRLAMRRLEDYNGPP